MLRTHITESCYRIILWESDEVELRQDIIELDAACVVIKACSEGSGRVLSVSSSFANTQ